MWCAGSFWADETVPWSDMNGKNVVITGGKHMLRNVQKLSSEIDQATPVSVLKSLDSLPVWGPTSL